MTSKFWRKIIFNLDFYSQPNYSSNIRTEQTFSAIRSLKTIDLPCSPSQNAVGKTAPTNKEDDSGLKKDMIQHRKAGKGMVKNDPRVTALHQQKESWLILVQQDALTVLRRAKLMEYITYVLDNFVSPLYSVSAIPTSTISIELIILLKRHFFSACCTLGVPIWLTLLLKVKKKISVKREK